jgi:hypothetical protein
MAWAIGIIIFLFLMFVSATFRSVVVVLIAVIGVGLWWFIESQQEKELRARSLIQPSEIELTGLRISRSFGTSYQVLGTVKNLSQLHILSSIILKFRAYDCPGGEITGECDVIGEATTSPQIGAPPGQVRSFDG